jgi:shikimate dehydrogenase
MHRRSCVIGWPAKHSRSPKLHGYWIKKYGLDADYRAEEVPPERFEEFLTRLAEHGYVGANITMPHKEMAFALSEPDERARAVGVSNTVWLDGARLRSTNTDVEGFIGALDAASPGWEKRSKRAVVLGAGGAGQAVIYGFVERAIPEIHVVNRTYERALAARERFGKSIQPARWEDIPRVLAGAGLLANTTSLGMVGKEDLEIDLAPMAPGSVVADVIYVPLRTTLLKAAAARGFAVSNGLDMLLYQAVRGFELWFGVRPEVTVEQRAMLIADLPKD